MLSEISQTEKDKYCYQFYVDIYHFLYILLSFMLPWWIRQMVKILSAM